ncbi:MAG TPA: hypothetical protein VK961_00050 [Chthoniobacter sp.]|nr:hypothetical protein [Chthoniobacter sp.]
MSQPSKKTVSTVVVLDDKTLAPNLQRLAKFQKVVVKQVELIGKTELANTERRLYVGLALIVIKNATEAGKHGNFLAWLKANVKDAGYTQCTYMMRAARIFFDETGLGRTELLSLVSGGSLTIAKKGPGGDLQKAARAFVGESTWGEILAKYEIRADEKTLGGARPKKTTTSTAVADHDALYTQSRDELGSLIERGKTLFLTENKLQYLAGHPEEIAGVVEGIRGLADEVEKAAKEILKPAKK